METKLKEIIKDCIDKRAGDLKGISDAIWKKPELGNEEFFAHDLLTKFLTKEGFQVKREFPLKTSFVARYGNPSGLKAGVLCEYDALPGIGHACGHNLIAEAGIGAALGLKALLMHKPDLLLEVIVYGTPDEEGGTGKCDMIKEGVFDETDICLMSHPTPYEIPVPIWLTLGTFRIEYTGKPAHGAAMPWKGVNALDAAVECYNGISMLRQQMKPTCRVHAVITDGGSVANVIPERSELLCDFRGIKDEDALELFEKVKSCALGAAEATGCTVKISDFLCFNSCLKTNPTLIDLYVQNAKGLGVPFEDEEFREKMSASTDMGNVSQLKPSIHPLFKIQTDVANHTHGFTAATGSPLNQKQTLNSAKSMAMTVLDVVLKPSLLKTINEEFKL